MDKIEIAQLILNSINSLEKKIRCWRKFFVCSFVRSFVCLFVLGVGFFLVFFGVF